MQKRRSNAMEAGESLSPPRKKFSLCASTSEGGENSKDSVDLDYEPIRFLRCHSKFKKDFSDVSTQIWQCAFEPSLKDPEKTTRFVATCGGTSVCVIDVKALGADVERKYFSPDSKENFFALSWTTLLSADADAENDINILAVGGCRGEIHFIHPETNTMFHVHMVSERKRCKHLRPTISSLQFDKNFPSILYCSFGENVYAYDIGNPRPPEYDMEVTLVHKLSVGSEIVSLAVSADPYVLLAAANDGLYGWENPSAKGNDDNGLLRFKFPESKAASESGTSLVDSVVCLSEGRVATKCALHGCIYVWDLSAALTSSTESTIKVGVERTLRWSDTDNYFMNMGFSAGSNLLACGDDKGMIWIYDLLKDSNEPTALLDWPITEDPYIAKKKKLRLTVYDILVDKVAIDWSGKNLVAVTSNNMVCIWRRSEC